jgi:hypothetical protein
MKILLPWKKKRILLERDLRGLEKHLSSTLTPIEPRPEYIKKLRVKLVGKESRKFLNLSPQKIQDGLLLVGGILSLFVVVFTGIRAVLALLSALGLLQLKKQVEDNSKAPFQPTT